MSDLIAWKNKAGRKPLILRGARQVGKTWLLKKFGRTCYDRIAYIDLEQSTHLHDLFSKELDIPRIITALQVASGVTIRPADTLIVLDEIQAAPAALTALKYFCDEYPEYPVAAAGSLLGVALHADISFPVGKVEFMDLYPLSFAEFLKVVGEEQLLKLLTAGDWPLVTAFRDRYIHRLRQYYYVGGMPDAVAAFSADQDYRSARDIQKQILQAYELDFSKHAPATDVPRIRMVWNAIPAQLARENRKFVYGLLREGARAREYELAISWLEDCGLVYKVRRVSAPGIPLKAYEDPKAFKLFAVDIGLLSAMCDLDQATLIKGHQVFSEFKGALTEQFVYQQLKNDPQLSVSYWSNDSASAEVDFVVQASGQVWPLEVKAEENLQAKSLRVYHERFRPGHAYRTSMSDYRRQEWMTNLPLYAIHRLGALSSRDERSDMFS